jgi:outer membrane protein
VRINIDVLNAQSQLYQTQRDLAQARYNVLVGQLKLRQAAGQLQMQDIHGLNQLIARPEDRSGHGRAAPAAVVLAASLLV